MSEFQFIADDLEATDRLGRMLAEAIPAGTVVALIGILGAGKTRLVQAVAVAVGNSPEDITSPTFVLVNEYLNGKLPVYHFDTYRLKDEDEFLELGPEEYFDGSGITFIEWADRVEACMPADYLTVRIEVLGESSREFTISTSSESLNFILNKLSTLATS